jgi:hypothetical protein
MVSKERSAVFVRGHQPHLVPPEAPPAGLTSAVAFVLSTYRSDDPDMVIDHELWLACMAVVSDIAGRTSSEVFLEPKRRFLEQLRRRRRGASAGTLEDYAARVRADPAVDEWEIILWRNGSAVVAAATCERWYMVGGLMPYHDSYTTCLFVAEPARDALVDALRDAVAGAGGYVEGVVDASNAA